MSKQSIETGVVAGQSSANARTTAEPEARGQSSSNTAILAELKKRMNTTFHSELKAVSNRVDRIAESVYGPPAKKRSRTAESPRRNRVLNWADRTDSGLDTLLPRFEDFYEADSEDECTGNLQL